MKHGPGSYLVLDPNDDHNTGGLARNAPANASSANQTVTVAVEPGTGDALSRFALQLLEALGKDVSVDRPPSTSAAAWELAQIWLDVSNVRRLLIVGAEHLSAGLWKHACTLTRRHPARWIVLIAHGRSLARGHRAVATTADLATVSRAQFEEWIAAGASQYSDTDERHRPPRHRRSREFPAVPTDELPFFLPTCRRSLSEKDLELVEGAFLVACEKAARWLDGRDFVEEDEVAGLLRAIIGTNPNIHRQLTQIRGVQAAFLRHYCLLKVSPEAFASGARSEARREMTPETFALLDAYIEPRIPLLAALALECQLTPAELSALNADQFTQKVYALRLHQSHAQFVLSQQAGYFRTALMLQRERSGLQPDGPLFVGKEGKRLHAKSIQQTLRKTAQETGLPLVAHWSPSEPRGSARWLHRRGISLHHL